jgi:3-(3-hydroxy-phenyl)propionate hydroxylase
LLRDAVLSLSLTEEFVRPLYHWRTSRPHEYKHSLLNSTSDDNAQFTGGPALGAPPQNVQLQHDDFLLDHLGGGFDLVYVCQSQNIPNELLHAVVAAKNDGLPLKLLAISDRDVKVQGADTTLFDPQQRFQLRYGVSAGGAYLFRPDQHVCARWLEVDATRLLSSLQLAVMQ